MKPEEIKKKRLSMIEPKEARTGYLVAVLKRKGLLADETIMSMNECLGDELLVAHNSESAAKAYLDSGNRDKIAKVMKLLEEQNSQVYGPLECIARCKTFLGDPAGREMQLKIIEKKMRQFRSVPWDGGITALTKVGYTVKEAEEASLLIIKNNLIYEHGYAFDALRSRQKEVIVSMTEDDFKEYAKRHRIDLGPVKIPDEYKASVKTAVLEKEVALDELLLLDLTAQEWQPIYEKSIAYFYENLHFNKSDIELDDLFELVESTPENIAMCARAHELLGDNKKRLGHAGICEEYERAAKLYSGIDSKLARQAWLKVGDCQPYENAFSTYKTVVSDKEAVLHLANRMIADNEHLTALEFLAKNGGKKGDIKIDTTDVLERYGPKVIQPLKSLGYNIDQSLIEAGIRKLDPGGWRPPRWEERTKIARTFFKEAGNENLIYEHVINPVPLLDEEIPKEYIPAIIKKFKLSTVDNWDMRKVTNFFVSVNEYQKAAEWYETAASWELKANGYVLGARLRSIVQRKKIGGK